MKRIIMFFTVVLLTASAFAQAPEKLSYQAVIRDADNHLVTEQSAGMQISILQGSANGTEVYRETQTATTNANGLVSIDIGGDAATVVSGDFSAIDWANGPYYMKTETDPAGGTSYTITGISQLLSVPYALHAKTAEFDDNSVTSAKIADGTIQSADIGANQIGADEIADMHRTLSVPAGSFTSTSTNVSSEYRGWEMNATYKASVTGYIALPAEYAGGDLTVYLYFVNNSGSTGVVDFFIRAAGRKAGELLSDPSSIESKAGISVSTNTYTLYRQEFTVTNIADSDDILHIYSIQRGGKNETHTGTVVLVGAEVEYLASY